jgi:16S rRNA (guanine966-N2)-methyltransferase
MRVIAGHLKGREFKSPPGHKAHPMGDKVRGALFNVLGDIEGLTFLDAFTGSGALAFEAISRGAKSVIAVDRESAVHKTISQNVKDLHLQAQIKVVKANVGGWSIHNMEKKFDIVLLDPPYNDIQPDLLQRLAKRHAQLGGLVVLSLPPKADFELPSTIYRLLSTKSYGDAQLVFYRKIK